MKPWALMTKLNRLVLICKLDRVYDPTKLLQDFENLTNSVEAKMHFNPNGSDGGWSGVPIYSRGGSMDRLDSNGDEPYQPTMALKLMPYFREVLKDIGGEMHRVRLLGLDPGKKIFWHSDDGESMDFGRVRLHIPIITNSDVDMYISHEKCEWRPGELWYGDFTFPHFLFNRSDETRYHLVIDVEPNERILQMFPKSYLDTAAKRGRIRKQVNLVYKILRKSLGREYLKNN